MECGLIDLRFQSGNHLPSHPDGIALADCLDKTLTMGGRTLRRWLLMPLTKVMRYSKTRCRC